MNFLIHNNKNVSDDTNFEKILKSSINNNKIKIKNKAFDNLLLYSHKQKIIYSNTFLNNYLCLLNDFYNLILINNSNINLLCFKFFILLFWLFIKFFNVDFYKQPKSINDLEIIKTPKNNHDLEIIKSNNNYCNYDCILNSLSEQKITEFEKITHIKDKKLINNSSDNLSSYITKNKKSPKHSSKKSLKHTSKKSPKHSSKKSLKHSSKKSLKHSSKKSPKHSSKKSLKHSSKKSLKHSSKKSSKHFKEIYKIL